MERQVGDIVIIKYIDNKILVERYLINHSIFKNLNEVNIIKACLTKLKLK